MDQFSLNVLVFKDGRNTGSNYTQTLGYMSWSQLRLHTLQYSITIFIFEKILIRAMVLFWTCFLWVLKDMNISLFFLHIWLKILVNLMKKKRKPIFWDRILSNWFRQFLWKIRLLQYPTKRNRILIKNYWLNYSISFFKDKIISKQNAGNLL